MRTWDDVQVSGLRYTKADEAAIVAEVQATRRATAATAEQYRRQHDAGLLEEAAAVVRERFRHTFALSVIARTLERLADRLRSPSR